MFLCRSYTPSIEDVGSFMALYWLPARADGKLGKPLVSICDSPVAPGKVIFPFLKLVNSKS